MAERLLTSEPLHVDPAILGAPLASPGRRFAAIALDAILLLVPTIAAILGVALLALRVEDPAALRAIRTVLSRSGDAATGGTKHRAAMRDLAPLLVRVEAPGLPGAATAAVEEGDLEKAADVLQRYDLSFALNFGEHEESRRGPGMIALPVQRVIPAPVRAIVLFAVPALYFVVLTRTRRGATLGKLALGIRVARLDGERLSWFEALERFIGYVHIPATLFLGIADLWRDPNRRMAHDRTVHTAVLRVRAAKPSRRHAGSNDSPR